jgi:hypothetical protein
VFLGKKASLRAKNLRAFYHVQVWARWKRKKSQTAPNPGGSSAFRTRSRDRLRQMFFVVLRAGRDCCSALQADKCAVKQYPIHRCESGRSDYRRAKSPMCSLFLAGQSICPFRLNNGDLCHRISCSLLLPPSLQPPRLKGAPTHPTIRRFCS